MCMYWATPTKSSLSSHIITHHAFGQDPRESSVSVHLHSTATSRAERAHRRSTRRWSSSCCRVVVAYIARKLIISIGGWCGTDADCIVLLQNIPTLRTTCGPSRASVYIGDAATMNCVMHGVVVVVVVSLRVCMFAQPHTHAHTHKWRIDIYIGKLADDRFVSKWRERANICI